eukprot:53584-Pyramimonas_sp.AAC.1
MTAGAAQFANERAEKAPNAKRAKWHSNLSAKVRALRAGRPRLRTCSAWLDTRGDYNLQATPQATRDRKMDARRRTWGHHVAEPPQTPMGLEGWPALPD